MGCIKCCKHGTDVLSIEAFNQPIDKWNVSNVKEMANMFHDALSFKQTLPDEWKKKAGYA